jgi:hypothetical protein
MSLALEIAVVLLVAVAMTTTLAHALELPGKLRLPRETYLAVQQIYYPGFTIAGFGEVAALLATLSLALIFYGEGVRFWLTLGAFLAVLAMHVAYWLVTHPVNGFWLKDFELKGAGAAFFSADPLRRGAAAEQDWTALRDRWEWSHVLRAALSVVALILLAAAIAL